MASAWLKQGKKDKLLSISLQPKDGRSPQRSQRRTKMWASKMKFDYLHIRVTKETKTAIRQAAKAATKERAGWSR